MKRTVIVGLILLMSTAMFAQKVSGGLFIGPNLSWFGTDSKLVENEGVRLGYTFGAMADYNLVDNFAVCLAIKYNNVGGNLKYKYGVNDFSREELGDTTITDPYRSMKFKLDYLEIPIGFKGETNEIGYMTYSLKAGITPAVRIKGKADVDVSSDDVVNDEINLFTMGWHIGGGVEYSLSGSTRLFVELVYTGFMLDFDKTEVFSEAYDGANTSTSKPKIGVNNIMLTLGVLF